MTQILNLSHAVAQAAPQTANAWRVERLDDYGVVLVVLVPVTHQNEQGHVVVAGGHFDRVKVGRGEAAEAHIAKLVAQGLGPAGGLVKVTQVRKGRDTWIDVPTKAAVVHTAHNAKALCGAKMTSDVKLGRRYDPWNKHTVQAEQRRSIFVPSFAPVSCKRCSKAQGTAA